MGQVAERLAELTITCRSPDDSITARIRAGEPVALTFRPGAYERYAEPQLAYQLARTAVLLYIGHERGVQRVMENASLYRPTSPAQAGDETQRRFLQELQSVAATGASPLGLVRFEISGMADWRCQIAPGTVASLPEPEFVTEAIAAARDLLRRSRFEKALLKNEFFGARHAPPVLERIRRRSR